MGVKNNIHKMAKVLLAILFGELTLAALSSSAFDMVFLLWSSVLQIVKLPLFTN